MSCSLHSILDKAQLLSHSFFKEEYMYRRTVPLFISLLCVLPCSADESKALTVDRAISGQINMSFPNDENIKPKPNDFDLNNYVLMSNELGERWAVITMTNSSSGNRVLQQEHLLALFANGKRKSPKHLKLNFEPNETQSITVSFGQSKFPILSISSKAE